MGVVRQVARRLLRLYFYGAVLMFALGFIGGAWLAISADSVDVLTQTPG
jgi:hypothetical protein